MTNSPTSADHPIHGGSPDSGPDFDCAPERSDPVGALDTAGSQPNPAVTHLTSVCTRARSNYEQAEAGRLEALAQVRGADRRERQHVEILSPSWKST
jgi:hypothetical protein